MRAGRAWRLRRGRKQRAGKVPTVGAEGRTRAERTENVELIAVTLDVSRLSGWLNSLALCRAEGKHKRADVRIGRGGRAWGRRRRRMQRAERPRLCRLRAGHARSAP